MRYSGTSPLPCSRDFFTDNVVSSSFFEQPQNGNGPPDISRFIRAASAKRLLVLSGLSFISFSRKSRTDRHGAPLSFSAADVPFGNPSGKSTPSSTRSPRLRQRPSSSASSSMAFARVGGLDALNASFRRESGVSAPIQIESAPVAGFDAALQSTIT